MKVTTYPQGDGVTHVHKTGCKRAGNESGHPPSGKSLTYDDVGHYEADTKAQVSAREGGKTVFFGCTKGLKAR